MKFKNKKCFLISLWFSSKCVLFTDVKTDLLPVQIDTGNNSNISIADSAESGEPEYLTGKL